MERADVLKEQYLLELFMYDPETGIVRRRPFLDIRGRKRGGQPAGTKTPKGYVIVQIEGQRYMAHRLAWLYVYGAWPKGDLDHINEIKDDNRIANLREATRAQNMHNVTRHKHNTSGRKGVSWMAQRKKWRAYIFHDYRQVHLGLFDTFEEAVAARVEAETRMTTPPRWATGLPLAAEVHRVGRYGK